MNIIVQVFSNIQQVWQCPNQTHELTMKNVTHSTRYNRKVCPTQQTSKYKYKTDTVSCPYKSLFSHPTYVASMELPQRTSQLLHYINHSVLQYSYSTLSVPILLDYICHTMNPSHNTLTRQITSRSAPNSYYSEPAK